MVGAPQSRSACPLQTAGYSSRSWLWSIPEQQTTTPWACLPVGEGAEGEQKVEEGRTPPLTRLPGGALVAFPEEASGPQDRLQAGRSL